MKALKIIGIILVLFIVLVLGGGYYLVNNLGRIVKYAVETTGPELTQTSVSLSDVEMDLAQGKVHMQGFQVGNPQGFNSDYLFNLGNLLLEIDNNTVTGEVIVLKNLDIDGIEVQLEQKGSQVNLWQLQKTLQSASEPTSQADDSQGGGEKRFMIENLRFAEGRMTFISDKFGTKQLTLPTLTVENLGNRSEGLTSKQLGIAILNPLLDNAKREAAKVLQGELKDKIGDKLKEKLQQELGEELTDKLKGGKNIDKAKEKLKSLF